VGVTRHVLCGSDGPDAFSIATVHVRSWKAAFPGLIPQPYLDALTPEDRVGAWEHTLAAGAWPHTGTIMLLGPPSHRRAEGPVHGCVSFSPTRDLDLAPVSVGEIVTIYLDPPAGVGRGRPAHERGARGVRAAPFTTAALWVLPTNARARRLYERRGWVARLGRRGDRPGQGARPERRVGHGPGTAHGAAGMVRRPGASA
jgi:hypothetical protein